MDTLCQQLPVILNLLYYSICYIIVLLYHIVFIYHNCIKVIRALYSFPNYTYCTSHYTRCWNMLHFDDLIENNSQTNGGYTPPPPDI